MTISLALSRLRRPIAAAVHPRAAELAETTLSWLAGHGLGGADPGLVDFTARTLPDALPERAELVARYTCWAALLRAELLAAPAGSAEILDRVVRFGHVLDAPEAPVPGGDPFALALSDLLRRGRRMASPLQLRRFTEAVRSWWLGLAAERAGEERGWRPGLAEWTVLRPQCGGAAAMSAKVELALGPEVPEWELNGPVARAAVEAAWTVALADLDLHACQRAQEPALNLVSALRADDPALSVVEAFEAAVDVRDRALALFLRLRSQLLPLSGPAMRRYLTGVGRAVAGTTEWRFGPAPGGPSIQDTVEANLQPLAVPTVSWWWDQLDSGARVPGPRGPFG
ncbi:terpene synthase family protein [Allokutzneria albata]|uniref:Terpene synthase family, metal binding domain n=1 Tax=Allokutzneria albata TaxID=211114 RepID=A0A1G9QZJ0_ALLAB|nr:hypothetical protein [Allokutzneria albata]SDM16462.1 hypothetical protein SAMN04489726_0113 [Allokutzneria albata]